ncbi:MAG: glycosyltransferase family 39 protein [Candidatus Eremiobacteraeota bacterium]|nr:glycosyltransferase family 39 protein [Candidatus Eremiobacteraeota bacterium]
MFKLFNNEKDRKYILTLITVMLIFKILGSMFVGYYCKRGKTQKGLVFRDKRVIEQKKLSPTLLALGYHWDSIHYVNTSMYWGENFRKAGQLRNFAYIYPLSIMILGKVIGSNILAAVILSNLFSILAAIAFYFVCRIYMTQEKSFSAAVILSIYPAFFVSGLIAYAEPMFLFFAILSWYYFEKENYLISAVLAGLCLCTRTAGAIIIPIYFVIFLYRIISSSWKEKKIVLPKAVCLWYLIPIVFLIAQVLITKYFVSSAGFRTNSFAGSMPRINAHFVPVFSPVLQLKQIMKNIPQALELYMYLLPAILLAVYLKKFRWELFIYAAIAIFSVMSISETEVFRAIPRHLLNAWPVFISLGDFLKNRYLLLVVSVFFFMVGLMMLHNFYTFLYI